MELNIRVVVKEPGKLAETRMMEDSLESLQKIVGGYIERVGGIIPEPYTLYCNDEGKIRGMNPNIFLPYNNGQLDIAAGPVVVLSSDPDGESKGLTEIEAQRVEMVLNLLSI